MAGLLDDFKKAVEEGGPVVKEALDLAGTKAAKGAAGVAGAALAKSFGFKPEEFENFIEDRYVSPLEKFVKENVPGGVRFDPGIDLNFRRPSRSSATPTYSLDSFLSNAIPGSTGEAGATVNYSGITNPFIRAEVPIYDGLMANIAASLNQPTSIGANYQTDILGGNFSAGISTEVDRTSSVKDFIDNITAGFKWRKSF